MNNTDPYRSVGFAEHVGYRTTLFEEGRAEMELEIQAHHLNGHGIAHGGVLLSVLDAVGGLAGCYGGPDERLPSVTLNLTTNFLTPLRAGRVRCIGTRSGGGKSVFFSECRALDEDGNVVATATGAYRLFSRGKRMDRPDRG